MHNNSKISALLLRRSCAFLYDCLLLIAIFFVVTSIAIAFNQGESINHSAYKFVLYVIAFLFFNWFWQHGGQTLGMRAWRIELQNDMPGSITLGQCARRYVTGTLTFGVTLVFALFDSRQRALHDRLSGTKIVLKNN